MLSETEFSLKFGKDSNNSRFSYAGFYYSLFTIIKYCRSTSWVDRFIDEVWDWLIVSKRWLFVSLTSVAFCKEAKNFQNLKLPKTDTNTVFNPVPLGNLTTSLQSREVQIWKSNLMIAIFDLELARVLFPK